MADQVDNFLESNNLKMRDVATTKPTSITYFRTGELVTFRYRLQDRLGVWTNHRRLALVVENDTGRNHYLSLRSNYLVSCFILSGDSSIDNIILKRAYRNKSASRARILVAMKHLLGIESYRTFRINRMSQLKFFNLNIDSLAE